MLIFRRQREDRSRPDVPRISLSPSGRDRLAASADTEDVTDAAEIGRPVCNGRPLEYFRSIEVQAVRLPSFVRGERLLQERAFEASWNHTISAQCPRIRQRG